VDGDRFDVTYGARAALFTVVPLFVGLAVGAVEVGVLVALGALNLLLVQAPRPGRTPFGVLGLAVVTNTTAWAAGMAVGTLSGPLEWGLVGVGVFVVMLAKRYSLFNQLALVTAVMFVVAAGLPGGWDAIAPNTVLILIGGTWGLFGGVLPSYIRWVERPLPASAHLSPAERVSVRTTVSYSVAVAVTVALGLATGQLLGLPRDYWVMLTILAAFRPELADTFDFAAMRMIGTVAGAGLVFALTLEVTNDWILSAVIVVAAALTFAVRAVNYALYSVFLTIFLILLLSLAYHAGPSFAVIRVVDTVVGGAFAVAAGLVLSLGRRRERSELQPPRSSVPPHAV
jgi:hypothetical protein